MTELSDSLLTFYKVTSGAVLSVSGCEKAVVGNRWSLIFQSAATAVCLLRLKRTILIWRKLSLTFRGYKKQHLSKVNRDLMVKLMV